MGNITNPELRGRADQSDILIAFAERLRENPLLNEQNAIVDNQPIPTQFPAGGFCVCVAPGDGRFPGNFWEGGHHTTAVEQGQVIIGVYVQIRRDRPGRREQSLMGRRESTQEAPNMDRPSLLIWKRDILQLLTVEDPRLGTMSQAWEPSKDGIPLCRSIPIPRRVTGALDVPQNPGWIGLQITFDCEWDWELYGQTYRERYGV